MLRILLLVAGAVLASAAAAAEIPAAWKLSDLPLLSDLTVGQFSSRNLKGVNGDSGGFLYRDQAKDAVICDLVGAGCVRSIWATMIDKDAVLKFYFDGEATPRHVIPMQGFFQGAHPAFQPPLVGYERRGHWGDNVFAGNCFVPIPFANGLRIAVAGRVTFYHILYELLPRGANPPTTFAGGPPPAALLEAFARRGQAPADLPPGEALASTVPLLPGGRESDSGNPNMPGAFKRSEAELFRISRSGCIRQLVIEGDGSDEFLRNAYLCMSWDDATLPQIMAPIGMFFANAVCGTEMRAMPMRSELLTGGRIRLSCWWPMPFWQGARISLVNRSAFALGPVSASILLAENPYPEGQAGYFTTCHREGLTEHGRDWLLFDGVGAGRLCGVVQSMSEEHYCEGNERFAVDGAIQPQIAGTGTEDYFLGCFWPNPDYGDPFAGCVGDVFREGGGSLGGSYRNPSCYYRFHLEMPIPFNAGMDARIQHGGLSDIASRYRSLAFAYQRLEPALVVPDLLVVGNAASERMHGYTSAGTPTGPVTTRPEGGHWLEPSTATGRVHRGGEIAFNMAIDPDNRGIRLRRRLDQQFPRQKVQVFIDGVDAGGWYHAGQNDLLRWVDDDIDLDRTLTAGKQTLAVRLVVAPDSGPFTDFRYQAFSRR